MGWFMERCGMECRNITDCDFKLILSELSDSVCQVNLVETVVGYHEHYGVTTLIRDGLRRMVLVDHSTPLDRFLAERAFLAAGAITRVDGRG